MTRTGTLSAKQSTMELKGKNGKSCIITTVGGTGDSTGMFGESQLGLAFVFAVRGCQPFAVAMACSIVGMKILKKMWEGPCWEGVWPHLDPWDVVGLRTTSGVWNVPRKYGPHGELFFFLIKKEPFALTKDSGRFNPSVPAETHKACALIGLHLLAAGGVSGSSGSQSPDLGVVWRYGCPKSPDWDSDGESWSESEGTSSSELCEHKCRKHCSACHRAKLVRRKGVPFPGGLGTCEGGLKLPRCPGYVVPGNAWDLVAGLPLPGEPTVTASEAFLSPWTGCDREERDVVRENTEKEGV